ncbi:hypothetical protein ACEWY4_002773 [Coilia grayii]|uniref:Uncharacterized protein n=1 Tax=Coilia grayii TaxID=363190 RepID=A0ABD1KPE0_9TELE
MADILEAVFKRHGCLNSQPQTGDQSVFCNRSTECSSVVVAGERGISRALLFLAAVTAAADLDLKVLFYTHTAIQKFPVPVNETMTDLKPDSLKKIKFVYRRSLEELLLDVASQHELASGAAASAPSLVLVDGLDSYLHGIGVGGGGGSGGGSGVGSGGSRKDEMSTTAHLAALLMDTSSFLTRIHEEMADSRGMERGAVIPCRVIASYHSDVEAMTADPVLGVLDRYFPTRCTLVKDAGSSGGGDEFAHEWQVYLSGTGVRHGAANELEWYLVVHANGAMEFSPITKPVAPRNPDQQMERV